MVGIQIRVREVVLDSVEHERPTRAPVSGFRVQGSWCRVQGSGSRVQGSGFRVQGSGFRVGGKRPDDPRETSDGEDGVGGLQRVDCPVRWRRPSDDELALGDSTPGPQQPEQRRVLRTPASV